MSKTRVYTRLGSDTFIRRGVCAGQGHCPDTSRDAEAWTRQGRHKALLQLAEVPDLFDLVPKLNQWGRLTEESFGTCGCRLPPWFIREVFICME
jgi:hypothetical protein